jgi:hypothetical protein
VSIEDCTATGRYPAATGKATCQGLEVAGRPTQQLWFHKICLWQERRQPWWEQVPGLMALLPLCDHGRTEDDAVKHAAQSFTARVADTTVRADLLT